MGKVIMSGIVEPLTKPIALPPVGTALEDMSWEDVKLISDMGLAADYFAVGDTKSVLVNGKVGTLSVNKTYKVFILGIDHNADIEGKGIHFGCFKTSGGVDVCLCDRKYDSSVGSSNLKYFAFNHWYSTVIGGWAGCDLRYDVLGSTDQAPSNYGTSTSTDRTGYDPSETCATNPVADTLMAALPAELRAVLKPVTKYSDNKGNSSDTASYVTATNDYLPLLAQFEVSGVRSGANSAEQNYQEQYAYYSAGNSKIKYKHNATTTAGSWLLRSVNKTGTSTQYVVTINKKGSSVGLSSYFSYGLAPLFVI